MNHRNPMLVPLVLLLACAAPAAGAARRPAAAEVPADTLRISLDDAARLAIADGPDARSARAGVGIAEGQVRVAIAQALPQVTGTVTYDHTFASIYQGLSADPTLGSLFSHSSFAAEHSWTASLAAHQTIWAAGRVGAAMDAARAVRVSTAADRDETLADLELQARTAYLEAAYARQVEAIAEEGLEQARAHLDQVKLLNGQGSRSEYDLLQAQVDAANQEPAAQSAHNAAEQALLQLRRLMNVPLQRPLALTTPLAFEDGQVPVLAAEPADGAPRPALAGAEAMVHARRAALRVERANRWPELTLNAALSQQAYPTDPWPTRRDFLSAMDASLQLQWPLFQGFRTFGAIQTATAELRRAEADRDRARQGVALEVEQSRQDAEVALATLAARRGTAELARRAHHLATVRWQNGLSTQLEVSDALLQMQTAEVNEVAAVKDYRIALLRLARASARPLALENRPIDQLPASTPNDGAHR